MTIDDVARKAGVSKATVSRVINGHCQIRPETKKAVLEIIRELGYVAPLTEKRILRGQKQLANAGKIGMLVPDVNEKAMQTVQTGRLLNGISQELQRHGMEIIFTKLVKSDVIPESVNPDKVRGLIVKNWVSNNALREALDRIPHVVCLETQTPERVADQVFPDTAQIASKVLGHFQSRKVGRVFTFVDVNQYPQRHRGEQFAAMARTEGMSVESVEFDSRETTATRDAIGRLAAVACAGTGLFISAVDSITTQLFIALHTAGGEANMGMDVVAAGDDPNLFNVLDGKISVVDLQFEEIGRAATQTLLWRLVNPASPQRRLQIAPYLKSSEVAK